MLRTRMVLFFLCIYIVWFIKELVFSHFQDETLSLLVIKIVVWILPVYFYLKYCDKIQNPFTYLKLKHNILNGITWGITISLLLVLVEVSMTLSLQGQMNFNLGLRWITTLIYAFPEEVLFRGFVLQKISNSVRFIKANLYTSLLFVSIHFPAWFVQGTTVPKFIFSMFTVFIVGFGLGYLFKRTNSLWSTTIVHTVYNLLLYARA